MTKDEIRKQIKQIKRELTVSEIHEMSQKAVSLLKSTTEFEVCEQILLYVSYNQEVETHELIHDCLQLGKKVCVPKVYGDVMKFHHIISFSDLKPGKYGILEPDNQCVIEPDAGLMIMPGLAFDHEFHRIGYGGGFYDKYLEKHRDLFKVALCFEFQMLEHIETEKFDLKPDMIITNQKVYRNS